MPSYSVADPHHIDADPDPDCPFDSDPDPACHFDADPDPACHLMRIQILLFTLMRNLIRILGYLFQFDADPDPRF